MKKIISLLLFTFILNVSVSGQMSSELKNTLTDAVKEQVASLRVYISYMADKDNDIDFRKSYKAEALSLFIAEGNSYIDDGIKKKGVLMETTSLYRKKPLRRLMRDYFDGVINYKYSKVEIESTQAYEMEVSNLKPVGDHRYECTVCYEQVFKAYSDGRLVYSDRTTKKMRVYIYAEETMDGIDYIIRLGDVTAVETKKLN